MLRGMSLANKCLLLFGGAIVLIVVAALSLPWWRMSRLVDEGQFEVSQALVGAWIRAGEDLADRNTTDTTNPRRIGETLREERAGIVATQLSLADATASDEAFIRDSLEAFRADLGLGEYREARWVGLTRVYLLAVPQQVATTVGTRLVGTVVFERRSPEAGQLLALNTLFLFSAGSAVLVLALLVFSIITRRLVLEPVRELRDTTERVREGNLAVRSQIATGDEFEQLAGTLNQMLSDLQGGQDRLRSINSALDLKLHELAESNTLLYQAAKVKGEFLANVSHELRTPLNSIIGFADLLMDQAKAESEKPDPPPSVAKRLRYLSNIINAGQGLLALINSILEMARIEAGKVDVKVERMNLHDACEGLLGLLQPLADKRGVVLTLDVAEDVPGVMTDVKRFQQIVFNFLANAVKFVEPESRTGRVPQVTLRAERLVTSATAAEERVRVSVIDNGPGIPREDQQRIFEKFYQRDAGHTKEHTGTGLGLAISKELAQILQCEIQLVSEPGGGSMFSLIMPLELHPQPAAEAALEAKFRSALVAGRDFE
jgi:two-component system, NarL family, sensor histidine kinase BarA